MDGNWYVRRGRIGRRTYWLQYALPLTAVSILATVLDISLGLAWYSSSYAYDGYSYAYDVSYMGGPISLLASLALLAPSVSAVVTRLHDRNHSAHWLWFFLVPIAGPIALLVVVGFLPGDAGPNDYGHPEGTTFIPAPRPPSWKLPTPAQP